MGAPAARALSASRASSTFPEWRLASLALPQGKEALPRGPSLATHRSNLLNLPLPCQPRLQLQRRLRSQGSSAPCRFEKSDERDAQPAFAPRPMKTQSSPKFNVTIKAPIVVCGC